MAALFSPLTVLAAVLLFLSTIASIMAGVGGMDETFLRDLPWLEGSAEVNVAEQLKLTNGYWMGLWNYCTTSSLDDGVNCAPLVNGTDNQLLLFSGKAKPAQESNVQVDGFTSTYITALPYVHVFAALFLVLTLVLAFIVSPSAIASLSFFAMLFQGAAFGTAFYFTLGVQKRVEEELNATFTISGYTASLVDQQSVFGIALWLSGGAAAATLIAFGIFTAAACGSIGAQSAKYRQSVYY